MNRRGHSNVHLEEIEPMTQPDGSSKARIAVSGGATLATVRQLPALVLTEQEWRNIGITMKWLREGRKIR